MIASHLPSPLAVALVITACAPLPDDACDGGSPPSASLAMPRLEAPCDIEVAAPTRLLLTTTDFATGAVSVVDLATGMVDRDVALATTDSIPSWHDGHAWLLDRYQYDRVEVLDPSRDWGLVAEHPLPPSCSASPNPQALVFAPDGSAWATQLDVPALARVVTAGDHDAHESIDLRAIPSDDDNPDAGLAVACGDVAWVAVQRLDASYGRVGPDELIAVDLAARTVLDLDASRDGAQGIRSEGAWLRQLRRDPQDHAGHTVLALSTGIERIDLGAGTRAWAVTPARFAAVGLGGGRALQAFDVDEGGETAFVAAYDDDFAQVRLWRVGLDDHEPAEPEAFADGFDSVERTLELVDDVLWYGSTRRAAPGLWQFDVTVDPPAAAPGPLSTGLPPYSMVAIP